MKILHRRQLRKPPRVSFVLLDWSCRESLHTLDYLAEQDVPRECYEILWIEYFSRRDPELRQRIEEANREHADDPVDAWIVMEMPDSVCHHKHLMYNIGILASRGELVCFCDSDAMMRPGFVRSIIEAFDGDPDIVLHHDEVRNRSPHYYPFRYPAFEDVLGLGCHNWVNGKTVGLWDVDDPLHTRNYGACMTARRDDLIAIGGADMHADYLGHVCGPYELTFRLTNAGRREVWNEDEFLYHTWHPGQAGSDDYCGPHDGRHMSTTALEARDTGRVLPLVECPAIEAERIRSAPRIAIDEKLSSAIKPEWLRVWSKPLASSHPAPRNRVIRTSLHSPYDFRMSRWRQVSLAPIVLKLLMRQYRIKYDKLRHASPYPAGKSAGMGRETVRRIRAACAFRPAALEYTRYLIRTCWMHLVYARDRGFREVAVCGDVQAIEICQRLARPAGVRVVCRQAPEDAVALQLPVLIAAFVNGDRLRSRLNALGVSNDRIIAFR